MKALDRLVTRAAREIRLLEQALRSANAKNDNRPYLQKRILAEAASL